MSEDIRGRFKSPRRDFVGPMPPRAPAPPQMQRAPQPPPPKNRTPAQLPLPPKPPKRKKTRKKRGKLFVVSLILILIAAGSYFGWTKYQNNQNPTAKQENQVAKQPEPEAPTAEEFKKTVRLVATGDMIPLAVILERGKQPDGTYKFDPMMANMKPYFEKSDVNFCNQATPAGGASFGYSGYPIFNAPLEWPRAIENVGCNVINIGSNHTYDKGQALVDATVAAWDKRPDMLAVVGANRNAEEQKKIRYFEKEGIKFAIFSYCTYSNTPPEKPYGINMYNKATADAEIAEAKQNADIVIVSMRWGTEYSAGVNAEQDKVAQELADAGADVVIGHGPHFMEPVKKLKGTKGNDTLVWFSIGNFLNAQLDVEALIGGFAIMDIDTSTKEVKAAQFMPVYMHYEWTPAQKAAGDLLSRTNLSMYPLDLAAEPMSKSLLGTTVPAQTDRVTKLLNTFTPVKIIKSTDF